jgi:hypothetical protein
LRKESGRDKCAACSEPQRGGRRDLLDGHPPSITFAVQPLRCMLQCSVKNEVSVPPVTERAGGRQRLAELREALLRLHKALLDSERATYEQAFGKIASPYQFLHLLTTDPWFAWLRPVTQIVTAMDEMLEAKEPVTVAGVDALAAQAGALLVATAGGEGFSGHYDEVLQRDPDVVFAHAAAARLIRAQAERKR